MQDNIISAVAANDSNSFHIF